MCTKELTSKIREIKEYQRIVDEATEMLESLKDEVKAEMTARAVNEMDIDVFKVRWTSVVSNRFDSASFKKTHKDLYEQYTKATESKRFSIA